MRKVLAGIPEATHVGHMLHVSFYSLSHNDMGDEGAKHLSSALQTSKTLKTLK